MSDQEGEERLNATLSSELIPKYKIGTVASMVGVSANVLRAWERRHELPRPARQTGKQRLYTDRDIRLLRRIVEMIQRGLSIGEVVALGPENLLGPPRQSTAVSPPTWSQGFEIPDEARRQVSSLLPDLRAPLPARRYAGESLDVSVRGLSLSDAATLHRIYQVVKGLYELWTYMDRQAVAEILERRLIPLRDSLLRGEIARLGASTLPREALLQAALHDAREGALRLLLECVPDDARRPVEKASLELVVSLGRDHAKILRNAFSDLDPALRDADEHLKAHQVTPILSKIAHLRTGGWVGSVGSDFQGFITSRCLETSALDRVLYRLLAASRRDPQSSPPHLWVSQRANGWVRWVFESPAGASKPDRPDDFVASVVGLAAGVSPDQALAQGYLGARSAKGREWLWFHWPNYSPPPQVSHCECHPLS